MTTSLALNHRGTETTEEKIGKNHRMALEYGPSSNIVIHFFFVFFVLFVV
jgi:hypothetical protein